MEWWTATTTTKKIDMKQEKRSEKHGIKRKMCKRIKAYFGRERGKRRKRGVFKKLKRVYFHKLNNILRILYYKTRWKNYKTV